MNLLYNKTFSFCVTPITITIRSGAKSIGSGFFWEKDNRHFLITNWHVVTKGDPTKPDEIPKDFPEYITIKLRHLITAENVPKGQENRLKEKMQLINTSDHTINLYKDSLPIWYESSKLCGLGKIDVVAIPLEKGLLSSQLTQNIPINKHKDIDKKISPEPSDDCFILGYPEGMSGQVHTPIWKRGSVATEPNLNYKDSPIVLADTATKEGMSGSPVVFRRHNLFLMDRNSGELISDPNNTLGELNNILGVYSGRIGDEKDVQLGYVWKKEVIDDILENI